MAIASASAASGDFGSAFGNRIFSITRIWFLSAWPAPTTVFFTWFGAYSATDIPNIAGASIATPRACPSFSVATPSLFTKVCSTAASTGRKSPSTAASPSWIAKRRLASGRASARSARASTRAEIARRGRKPLMDRQKAARQRQAFGRFHRAAANKGQPVAVDLDHAPAGAAQARIDAKNADGLANRRSCHGVVITPEPDR